MKKKIDRIVLLCFWNVVLLPTFCFGSNLEKITLHPARDYALSVSSNGRFMAFGSDRSGGRDIWIKDLSSGRFSIPERVAQTSSIEKTPALNQDGTKLLYVSHKSDPRGDIYSLDLITKEEVRVTETSSGDSFPFWSNDGIFLYYIKSDYTQNKTALVKYSPETTSEKVVMEGVSSCAAGKSDWIFCSDGKKIFSFREKEPKIRFTLTTGEFMDLWPTVSSGNKVYFSRYSEDTNLNGTIDTGDASSIWSVAFDESTQKVSSRFQITQDGSFHVYPFAAKEYLYFSDLQGGDIQRLHIPRFFSPYDGFDTAKKRADSFLDKDDSTMTLLVLGNIVRNFAGKISPGEKTKLEFEYIRMLLEEKRYDLAQVALKKREDDSDESTILKKVYSIASVILEKSPDWSATATREATKKGVQEIKALVSPFTEKPFLMGAALIEAGNLYMVANDLFTALDLFREAGSLENREIQARALLKRGDVYGKLSDQSNLMKMYADAIQIFGGETRWGKKAIQKAISAVEKGETYEERVSSLRSTIKVYPDLPSLKASLYLRIATIYYASGENMKAHGALDMIIKNPPKMTSFIEKAYAKKADIYISAEEYEKAALSYTAILSLPGHSVLMNMQTVNEQIALQKVREAEKNRRIGEIKIAAKSFRRIFEQYPLSVEAHRGYIETKAMLGKNSDTITFYEKQIAQKKDDPILIYSLGLALTYEKDPVFAKIIPLLESAVLLHPGIKYFHQTLGWAYEQNEKINNKQGFLEKAIGEYLAALELTDLSLFPKVEGNLLLNLGNAYFSLGSFHEAFRYYSLRERLTLPFLTKTTEILYRKHFGEACFKNGRTLESIIQFKLALHLIKPTDYRLKRELLDRIGLAHQDAGEYAKAVQYFSELLELNLSQGVTQNRALIQRNIGNNLYNMSISSEKVDRSSLQKALASYFESIESIAKFGVKGKGKSKGLLEIETGVGEGASQAARGFDRIGEEKLLFGYMAGAYENLSEPLSAIQYHVKKLDLYPDSLTVEKHVPLLTEKAVVLNRVGALYMQIGDSEKAITYFSESLALTEDLGLINGMGVNLMNLAKTYAQRVSEKKEINLDHVDALLHSFHTYTRFKRKEESVSFYASSHFAFLLYSLSSNLDAPGNGDITKASQTEYRFARYLSETLRLYQDALSLLENSSTFGIAEQLGNLMSIRLNLLNIYRENGLEQKYEKEKKRLQEIIASSLSDKSWIYYLSQAEDTSNPAQRKILLIKAAKTLLSVPALAYPQGDTDLTSPLAIKLSRLLVEELVQAGEHDQAFQMSEQLAMRRVTTSLYNALGETFFLNMLPEEYKEDIQATLHDIRTAFKAGSFPAIEENVSFYKEIVEALLEEAPVPASFLQHYPVRPEDVHAITTSKAAYLRVVQRAGGYYFLLKKDQNSTPFLVETHGEALSLPPPLKNALSSLSILYVAAEDSVYHFLKQGLFLEKSITRVNTIYDLINAHASKGLFISRGTVVGPFTPDPELLGEKLTLTLETPNGEPAHHKTVFENTNLLIATTPLRNFSFELKREMGIGIYAKLENIAPHFGHTAFLLNTDPKWRSSLPVMASALIAKGFPHIIVNNGKYDKESAEKLIALYLANLADIPAEQSLAVAVEEVSQWKGVPLSYSLYGYGGMDEQETLTYAAEKYAEELAAAVELYKGKQFAQALIGLENALWIIDFAGKEGDGPNLLKLIVEVSFKSGQYKKAANYQERLLSLYDEDADPEVRAQTLYTLGILYSRMEEYKTSLAYLMKAIAYWKETEELDRLAEGKSTLAVVKEYMGDYSAALQEFGGSFDLYAEMGEQADMVSMYRSIGRINYLRLGRYEKGRKNFEAAYALSQELGDKKGEAEALYEMGFTYEKMGLFKNADQQYHKGMAIGKALNSPTLIASGELYLANTSWFRGEYQDAFMHLTQAQQHAERSEDKQLNIMIENTKGLVFWTLNDTVKAMSHLKRAVSLSEKEQIDTELATSLNNLGLVYRQTGDLETSLDYFTRALEIDRRLKSKWGLGYDYRNIGMTELKLGRLESAEKNFLKAEKTSAEIKNSINQAKSLLELGHVNTSLGRKESAQAYFQKAFALSEKHQIKEVLWRAAAGTAKILRAKGEIEESFTWYKKAVTIVETMRAALKIDELRNSYQLNKLDLYKEVITLLVSMGQPEEAFNYLERGRSRSFIDLLGNQKVQLKNDGDEKALDAVNNLFLAVEAIAREISSHEKADHELIQKYNDAKSAYEEALITLRQNDPQLGDFVSVDPLTLKEFEAILDEGVGTLSYMISEDALFIWLITKTGTTFFNVKVQETELNTLIRKYRNFVQHIEPVDIELRRLYDILIRPVEKKLEGIKNLAIVPDGPLHYLSFSALKKDNGYLIEQFPLFYSPSASVFKYTFAKRNTNKKGKNTKVLAVGNPDLGSFNYDLPMAELEASSMQWTFPEVDILTGPKATEEWITANISSYGIIHIASHGEFNDVNPLLSALMLATEKNNSASTLTVKEIFSLDIQADLVTLSACQTGLGKLEAGELIGLNRAFIYAGTHSLISSLWRVDDLSTAVLMKHFYRNYLTMNKGESLRKAQLLIKKSFPHPSYWAGFSLVGDFK